VTAAIVQEHVGTIAATKSILAGEQVRSRAWRQIREALQEAGVDRVLAEKYAGRKVHPFGNQLGRMWDCLRVSGQEAGKW